MRSIKKYLPFFVVVIYFLLQLPFLNADPDKLVDPLMRHAWTDEGLYASQIRNFVDHGSFDIKENSTFVRGPFFNIIQLPFFYVFGTSLLTGRLIVLGLTLLVLFLFLKNEKLRLAGLFMFVFSLLEFHIFQFAHYSMAELICIDFILLSLYFIVSAREKVPANKRKLLVFFSAFFLFLSYSSKVQYLYVGALAPATFFFLSLNEAWVNRKFKWIFFNDFFWSVLFSGALAGAYYFLWFLPNKEFYLYVMSSETSARFGSSLKEFWDVAKFNYKYIIWTNDFKIMVLHFYLILLAGLFFFIFKRKKALHSTIAIFSLIWIVLELHKIPMKYLPNQYLLSLFFAIGLFTASMYSELITYFRKFRYVFFGLALVIGVYNLSWYVSAYKQRTYQLREINNYLSQYDLGESTIIGPWAASVTWKSNSKTLPVWDNYFNWKDPINTYKPAIVITEFDERDSDYAYKNHGIDLNQVSDSCKRFDVWNYKLCLYWISQPRGKKLVRD